MEDQICHLDAATTSGTEYQLSQEVGPVGTDDYLLVLRHSHGYGQLKSGVRGGLCQCFSHLLDRSLPY